MRVALAARPKGEADVPGSQEPRSLIRAAVKEDAERLALLSGQLGYPAAAPEIRGRLQRIQAREDGQVFVAEVDGAVVGWVHVCEVHFLESPAHAEIAGLVVDERCRGRGVGKELMAAAERWAASLGYTTVRLRSNVIREAAHRFYRNLGYSETKRQAVFSRSIPGGRAPE